MTTPEAPDADEADDGSEPIEDGDLASAIDPPSGPYEVLPKRIKLDTALAVRRAMVRVFADMRAGKLASVKGSRQIRALASIANINKELSFEKRLRKLEEIEESRRRSTRR